MEKYLSVLNSGILNTDVSRLVRKYFVPRECNGVKIRCFKELIYNQQLNSKNIMDLKSNRILVSFFESKDNYVKIIDGEEHIFKQKYIKFIKLDNEYYIYGYIRFNNNTKCADELLDISRRSISEINRVFSSFKSRDINVKLEK